ncbi:D-serine ammonia-lyase [Kurthia senegalensis]|uniref:D-serine ammonia-lyase n=1 Tax=Kurthia senegalensis TaxID=1033740 RepID=UPI00028859AA|nr:D-serine ammonia-lyase [Kurthia senegalensis]
MQIVEMLKMRKKLFFESPYVEQVPKTFRFDEQLIDEAEERLKRFAPYIAKVFERTKELDGLIESPITFYEPNHVYIKRDDQLPISGSIKARGGIYEVLVIAEMIAKQQPEFTHVTNYEAFHQPFWKELFGEYTIVVGSTGNLGLSIGVIGAALGFQVVVHMSHDAKVWKKQLLKKHGVTVIEHVGDYSKAVAQGREEARATATSYFIDDENSKWLFSGYAVAARRLVGQLPKRPTVINPLVVYIPCGVGGGPGGVIYGLKKCFGEAVKCVIVEPIDSPCMFLGIVSRQYDQIEVADIGLTNRTVADGLAVGRASQFVGRIIEPLVDVFATVSDDELMMWVKELHAKRQLFLEPSAVAGFSALQRGKEKWPNGTHLVWATGGGLVPDSEKKNYLADK